jgi:hypothetical protein
MSNVITNSKILQRIRSVKKEFLIKNLSYFLSVGPMTETVIIQSSQILV